MADQNQYVLNDEQLHQIIEQVQAESNTDPNAPKPPAAPPPVPIKIPIGGQEFTFNTPEEAGQAISANIADLQQKLAQAQTKPAAPPPAPAPADAPPQYSQEKFVELIQKDARQALDYALGHTLFEGKVPNASEVLSQKLRGIDQTSQVVAVNGFREAHPEISQDPRVGPVLQQVMTRLGLPETREGLELAYLKAQSEALLPAYSFAHLAQPPVDPNQQSQPAQGARPMPQNPQYPSAYQPQQPQYPGYQGYPPPQYPTRPFLPQQFPQNPAYTSGYTPPPPPPQMNRNSSPPNLQEQQVLAQFSDLSTAQMEEVMRRMGMQV